MPKQTKRAAITATRREYNQLTRAYHSLGKKAMGKPEKSAAKREYRKVQRERRFVGTRLGKLTGVHKGR
jgi:hypothetical protein